MKNCARCFISLSKEDILTVVGESELGKSAIASLLMNLYPIQKVKFFIIKQYGNNDTLSKITLIKDETYILKGTVFDHLAM